MKLLGWASSNPSPVTIILGSRPGVRMSGLTDRECMLDVECKIKTIQTFVDAVNPDIIYILHICGDTTPLIEEMASTGADGLSLDTKLDLAAEAFKIPPDMALLGNIDPIGLLLHGSPEEVENLTRSFCEQMEPFPNFILCTGCSVPGGIPPENLQAFLHAGKERGRCSSERGKLFRELISGVMKGETEKVVAVCNQGIEMEIDPFDLVRFGLVEGMRLAGREYQRQTYFIPELLLAAQAFNAGLDLLRPELLSGDSGSRTNHVVLATVPGDIHDLGKKIVAMMLEVSDFKITDLGVDVDIGKLIEVCRKDHPRIVGLSCLTTVGLEGIKKVSEAIEKEGLRNGTRLLIGGAAVRQGDVVRLKADAYAADAIEAVEVARKVCEEGD